MQCSELLLQPFSSAAASCACEQCCCVTHMQLPEMLCNGRWQEGSRARVSEPADGPASCCRVRRGCAGQPLSPRRLEESLPGEGTRAVLPPSPSHQRCNRRTQGRPEGSRWPTSEGASEREGFNPFCVRSALVSIHTLPLRVTSGRYSQGSLADRARACARTHPPPLPTLRQTGESPEVPPGWMSQAQS